jgi:hypothetical protein
VAVTVLVLALVVVTVVASAPATVLVHSGVWPLSHLRPVAAREITATPAGVLR